MHEFLSSYNIDAMVFGAIVSSIVLAFILLVVIFSLRMKSYQIRVMELSETVSANKKEMASQQEKYTALQILSASQQQEISGYEKMKERYEKSRTHKEEEVRLLKEKLEMSREDISNLQRDKKELEANLRNSLENLAKAEEEIENLKKRNEFWVEQISELRTKHDALKLQLNRLERSMGSKQ